MMDIRNFHAEIRRSERKWWSSERIPDNKHTKCLFLNKYYKLHIMKKILLSTFLCASCTLIAQNVTIPDANFKAYLLGNSSINTNSDTEIQLTEASTFSGTINCEFLTIGSLSGIESFTMLTNLNCRYNNLTSLNVSSNTALTSLNCDQNPITALNVSQNTQLLSLICNNTSISSLDLTQNISLTELQCVEGQMTSITLGNNTALTHLWCRDNQIGTLNLSQCVALEELHCEENQITGLILGSHPQLFNFNAHTNQFTVLDLSSLTGLTQISLQNNTNLSSLNLANNNNTIITKVNATGTALDCIQVDDMAYSNTNWMGSNFTVDTGLEYLEDCATVGVNDVKEVLAIDIYPNPTEGVLNIELNKVSSLKIVNLVGKTVATYSGVIGMNTVHVNNLPSGMYFIELHDHTKVRFIKL
jgi:hypothetical protein